ncbi:unnamed protein product, partial [Oppiella nova]
MINTLIFYLPILGLNGRPYDVWHTWRSGNTRQPINWRIWSVMWSTR